MLPFHRCVEGDFAAVNDLILRQLHSDVDLVEHIGQYLVEAGGKRLRPLVVLLMANALGYRGKGHLALAAIIEFIHTATLLHDDVVDTSNMRRGRLTANAKWGNAPSVLVGDFLYSRAFQMTVNIGDNRITKVLADTTNVISEGEVQQLVNAKNTKITEADYLVVIEKKTAVLFAAAAEMSAVLAGVSAEQQTACKAYGHHVGMAFQLLDDVLDYEGDSAALGKNVGDDLAEGKATLPLILAMQKAPTADAELIATALKEGDVGKIDAVVQIVRAHGGIEYTRAQAELHAQVANQQLAGFASSEYLSALEDLATFSVRRHY